jgi:hypothetical protein
MGMFDYVKIKVDLDFPDEIKLLKKSDFEWQTKSLDNCLNYYIIDSDKTLKEEVIEGNWKEIPENERTSPWRVADFEETNRYEKTIDYHGVLKFYCFEQLDDDYDFWLDYDAFFVYGKLDKVVLTEFKKQKSTRQYLNNYIKSKEEKNNIIKKIIGWKLFWRFLERSIYKICNVLSKIRYFIITKFI